jgi:hypothetical protein
VELYDRKTSKEEMSDNERIMLKWILESQDRIQWRDFVNMAMILQPL